VLGKEIVKIEEWKDITGRYVTRKKEIDLPNVHENVDFITECYHGGRNESFCFGATPEDRWRDIDLVGAYSTAVATMGMLDWDGIRKTADADEFTHEPVGYARVRFQFRTDTRFSGLPARLPNNLILPLRGTTYATSAEIAVARQQGCNVIIEKGRVVPVREGMPKPIFQAVKEATDGRNAAKQRGDELEDKLYKELINSFYGKFAQGLHKKRVFSTTEGETQDMEPSRVTQPFVAAHVTGLVRAVLSEIMNKIPEAYDIVSVTTDGFITNAPEAITEAPYDGPVCGIFREAPRALVDN